MPVTDVRMKTGKSPRQIRQREPTADIRVLVDIGSIIKRQKREEHHRKENQEATNKQRYRGKGKAGLLIASDRTDRNSII